MGLNEKESCAGSKRHRTIVAEESLVVINKKEALSPTILDQLIAFQRGQTGDRRRRRQQQGKAKRNLTKDRNRIEELFALADRHRVLDDQWERQSPLRQFKQKSKRSIL